MSYQKTAWPRVALVVGLCLVCMACSDSSNVQVNTHTESDNSPASIGEQLANRYRIPYPAIIAHRGDSLHAPEETRPAYLLARDQGADYLEADLQRTRDGILIALHDTDLRRTTNIEAVFPNRADDPVNTFTLAELKRLDAGSWFNDAFPERARDSYAGLKILTLDELRQIAEAGDNQPGLYLETKSPALFPGIEAELAAYLREHDWIGKQARQAPTGFNGDIDVGYSPGRVILQTFSKDSLVQLHAEMPDTPKILLLFLGGDGSITADSTIQQREDESDAAFQARRRPASPEAYNTFLDFARDQGAIGVGPSAARDDLDPVYSYADLADDSMIERAHRRGLLVHVYTLDDAVDFRRYLNRGVDGIFTNDPTALLDFTGAPTPTAVDARLEQLGY